MSDEFKKPLDEIVYEEQEVDGFDVKFDTETKQATVHPVKRKVKVPTIYSRGVTSVISCSRGKHNYAMSDRSRHIATCSNCPKNKFLRAVYETIRDGHIVDRDSGKILD